MNLEDIKRINREALESAKGSVGEVDYTDNTHLMVYAGAVAVAVGVYYVLMNKYTPSLVTTTTNGVETVDRNRVLAASLLAGLLVVVGYKLYTKE